MNDDILAGVDWTDPKLTAAAPAPGHNIQTISAPNALPPTHLTPGNPYERMVQLALNQDTSIEKLERLLAMQQTWEANEARKAYAMDLASMKATIPIEIFKKKQVNVPGGAKFKHAELADVVDACVEAMGKFGFVHRWKLEQAEGIKVTCIVTHKLGHSESTELLGPPDDSGKKNAIQQVGSTVTYLERYTLMAALGVAAKNQDDDGKAAGNSNPDPADAPDGFEDWKADMTAVADEGLTRLTNEWKKPTNEAMRRHVIKYYAAWWDETKAKAVQADRKSK